MWQSTHVGGDRFAGNLVALPDGVYYGRVGQAEVWPLLECALRGSIHLPHYRGRSCHSFPVQAAERAVREQTGLRGVADVRLEGARRAADEWRVRLTAAGRVWDVEVVRDDGELIHLTCGATELRHPHRYRAVAVRSGLENGSGC